MDAKLSFRKYMFNCWLCWNGIWCVENESNSSVSAKALCLKYNTLGLFKFVSDNLFDHQRVSQANWYWGFWLKWSNSPLFSEQRKQLQNKNACTPKEVLFMQMHSGDPFRKRQNRTQCLHLCREESTIFTETVVLKSGSSKMLREYWSGSLIRFQALLLIPY